MGREFSRAQRVDLNFLFLEAAFGDSDNAIFAERIVGTQISGPESNGGVVQIARVIKASISDELLVFAIRFWPRRSETEDRGER